MSAEQKWAQVEKALDIIRPYIQGDGGDVELIDVSDDGIVSVKLVGNCVGCGSAEVTLHDGIQGTLMGQLPWVRDVIEVGEDVEAGSPKGAGACGQLSVIMRNIEEKMRRLEFDALSVTDVESLPITTKEWSAWVRNEFGRLTGALDSCIYPMAELFLPSAINAVQTIRAKSDDFLEKVDLYDQALEEAEGSEIFAFFQATQAMLRSLQGFFLRTEGVLFTMLDDVLPDELRAEARQDVSNYLRRVYQDSQLQSAVVA